MISRCDECHHLFRHPADEPESIIEERLADATALGDAVRTSIRQSVSMRLCDRCLL